MGLETRVSYGICYHLFHILAAWCTDATTFCYFWCIKITKLSTKNPVYVKRICQNNKKQKMKNYQNVEFSLQTKFLNVHYFQWNAVHFVKGHLTHNGRKLIRCLHVMRKVSWVRQCLRLYPFQHVQNSAVVLCSASTNKNTNAVVLLVCLNGLQSFTSFSRLILI